MTSAAVRAPAVPVHARTRRAPQASRTRTRSLPIRIAPVPGEALESWLAAIAQRLDVTWGELLDAVAPASGAPRRRANRGSLTTWLNLEETAQIADATGVNESLITAMTLEPLAGTLVAIDTLTRAAATPWGHIARQRFCPGCLESSGGRWALEWRLPWVTVCQRHRCFLVDACPSCARYQSTSQGWCSRDHKPRPSRCRISMGRGGGSHSAVVTLCDVEPDCLPPGHPLLTMQRQLLALLAQPSVDAGVYKLQPISPRQLLVDIWRLGQRILCAPTSDMLAQHLGVCENTRQHRYWTARLWTRADGKPDRPAMALRSSAAVVATGMTAALTVLLQPSIPAAAEMLRRLTDSEHMRPIRPADSKLGRRPSRVLCGVDVATRVGQSAFATEHLRHHLFAALPSYPVATGLQAPILHHVPTALWPSWAFRLRVNNYALATQRQALSLLVTLVGSSSPQPQLIEALGCRLHVSHIGQVVAALHSHPRWPSIATALTRLHDRLEAAPPPIDYHRRRQLDYRGLLSQRQWRAISPLGRTTPTSPMVHHAARVWLFERVSGLPSSAEFPTAPMAYRVFHTDRFLLALTSDLVARLDELAADFLRRRGVTDEPVAWSAPLQWIDDLDLPGTSCAAAPVQSLHRILAHASTSILIYDAAHQLDLPVDVIRYHIGQHPLRRVPQRTLSQFERAKAALPEPVLRQRYENEGLSLTAIARQLGLTRPDPISRLARSYGMRLRHDDRPPIPVEWIYDQHVPRRRTLSEMAAELGVSPWCLSHRARKHGIPVRSYRRRRRPRATAIAREIPNGTALLPAMRDIDAWRRLQRFARASEYFNLAEAAKACGCPYDTLSKQIIRLETDFGKKLLRRAPTKSKPMIPTAFGHKIAGLVRQIEVRIDATDSPNKTGRNRFPRDRHPAHYR
jgi:TniQ/Bacterial regulatory helix-turn-helix protein, lysR family